MNQKEFNAVFFGLTDRRREVLQKVLDRETNKAIAKSLNITEATVRKHIEEICDLFGILRGTLGNRHPRRNDLIALFAQYKRELLYGNTQEVPHPPKVNIEETTSENSDSVAVESAITSSPSEDIEALVPKVRSHFNKTIREECATLCTFNLLYTPQLGNLSRMYVETKLNESQGFGSSEFSQERQLWDEVVLRHQKLMALGKPGAGKTTLLQYIALHCDEIEFQPKLVPIFISLKTLAENAKHPDKIDILGYLHKKYCHNSVSKEEIETLLNHGRLLFLLDGLDEVTEEEIPDLNEKIHNLIDVYSDNRFIVSCRKEFQAYQSKIFARFCTCIVANFERNQRNTFIKQWFDEVPVIGQLKRSANANELIKKLDAPENQRIQELADTPLLLHLICLIFQERGDLPSKRVDIYREAIDLLLEKWNLFNERLPTDVGELKKVLRHIAAITFEKGKPTFEETGISPFITNCSQTLYNTEFLSGLVVKKTWRQYGFSHQTFQEYLTAEQLVSSQQNCTTLVSHITDKRWREVFLLASNIMQPADTLLMIMKKKVDSILILDKTMEAFLNWVKQKSLHNTSQHNWKSRLFYISLYVDFFIDAQIDKLSELEIEELEVESSSYIYLAHELGLKLELMLNSILNDAITLWGIFNRTLEFEMHPDEVDNTDLSLNQDLDEVLESDIVPALKQKLKELKDQIPDSMKMSIWEIGYEEWWKNKGHSWIKKLRLTTIQYCNMGYDWQFNNKHKKLLKQYYDANKLLLDCMNSGCEISLEARSHIEDNLFLPP